MESPTYMVMAPGQRGAARQAFGRSSRSARRARGSHRLSLLHTPRTTVFGVNIYLVMNGNCICVMKYIDNASVSGLRCFTGKSVVIRHWPINGGENAH
jgi:hypothetical protein